MITKSCQQITIFCIPITLNNPIKVCFLSMKCYVSIQIGTIKFENNIFLIIEKPVLIENVRVIGIQNQLPLSFGTALVHNKIL